MCLLSRQSYDFFQVSNESHCCSDRQQSFNQASKHPDSEQVLGWKLDYVSEVECQNFKKSTSWSD